LSISGTEINDRVGVTRGVAELSRDGVTMNNAEKKGTKPFLFSGEVWLIVPGFAPIG
jgi:hypothetical protein